jgi:D-xylose transport system substrate-binding protein
MTKSRMSAPWENKMAYQSNVRLADRRQSNRHPTAHKVLAASGVVAGFLITNSAFAETVKIALLLPNTQASRYEAQDRPNFVREVKALCTDCEVLYSNGGGDATRQQQQFEAAIANGAKVVVMSSVDTVAAANLVDEAKKAGVTFVAYGRLVSNAPIDYYISGDNVAAGKIQAEGLLDALKAAGRPNGPVVVINGSPQDSVVGELKQGFQDVAKGASLKVGKEYDTPDWSPEGAQTEMDQAITALGRDGFTGVYSSNDGMAAGIIAAMKAAGVNPSTRPIVGMDAETSALQRVVAGEQYMTVYWPIKTFAEAAAKVAVAAAKGQKVPEGVITGTVNNGAKDVPTYFMRPIGVTKDKIASTVLADGFVKVEDICTSDFAEQCKGAGLTK